MLRRIALLIPLLVMLSMSGCFFSRTEAAGTTIAIQKAGRGTTTADA